MTTDARRRALGAALPPEVDAILVTHLVNVRYLTGFTGSNGALLVHRDGAAAFATDGRYAEQAAQQVPDLPVVVTRALAGALLAEAAKTAGSAVAVERQHMTLAAYDALRDAGVQLRPVDGLVERLRVHKDDDELAALREACAVTDAAFTEVLPELRPGVTETDVAWLLLAAMRRHGAEEKAFDSIVAFGPNSAVPHHQPTDRPLHSGDLVKLDFGARVRGYHADMTRTVVCRRAQEWQRDLHATVRQIQRSCRDATRPGAVPVELDALARSLVEAAGHEPLHGLGHGVGLDIHEAPFLVPGGQTTRLDDRVPVTVEPGIYVPGQGGVRIEDTVLVAADGAEPLTTSSRDLLEI